MRRTLQVARREVSESVRTKAFWIGILAFPVILVLSIGASVWLNTRKAARSFAVVDHSGWVAEAVEARAEREDLRQLFRSALQAQARGRPLEGWPAAGRELVAEIARGGRKLEPTVDAITGGGNGGDARLDEVRAWWRALGAEAARALDGDLARARFHRVTLAGADAEGEAARRVAEGSLFAYVVIGKDPLNPAQGSRYVSKNLTDRDLRRWFEQHATEVVRERRFTERGIDAASASALLAPVDLAVRKVSASGQEVDVQMEDTARQWLPVVFVYLLWVAVFVAAQMLLSNTIEEKANRLIEVLLSSVSPLELMSGKIIGIASTGLLVLGSWVAFFLLALNVAPLVFDFQFPIDVGGLVGDPVYLGSFLFYFLFGYGLIAALVAAIGSLCTSLKEAQSLWTPIVILLIVPILAMEPIGKDPNGTLARVLSFIPPFTPFVMMNRAAGPPAPWEYAATTVLMVVCTVAVFFGAAKVFRVGILMTGKPPKLREIFRLMRAPVSRRD